MPSSYTGNPTAMQAPSPAPGPGVALVIDLPVDTDARNSASIYQPNKAEADFITYLMKIINGQLPTNGNDAPQILLKDLAAKNRSLFDHNGLPGGQVNRLREEWWVPIAIQTATVNPITSNRLWQVIIGGTGSAATGDPDANYAGHQVILQTSATPSNKAVLATAQQVMYPGALFASWVLEWTHRMDAVGANGLTHWAGLSGSDDPSSPANGYCWFRKSSADTNWQCETNDGTSTTTINSGIAPALSSAAPQVMRIEFHGSASPYGANTARFFIDGALAATSTTNLPTVLQYAFFGALCTAAVAGHNANIGAVELRVSRIAAGGAI